MRKITHVLMFWMALAGVAMAAQRVAGNEGEDLRKAVREGEIDGVKRLLENGADVNSPVENNFTQIFFASDLKMVDLLLQYKPNLGIRAAGSGQTPIEHAAEQLCRDKEKADVWRAIVQKLRGAGAEYTIATAIYLNGCDRLRSREAGGSEG